MTAEALFAWLTLDTTRRRNPAWRAVEARWERAVISGRDELADQLFRHLWPGVFELVEAEELSA